MSVTIYDAYVVRIGNVYLVGLAYEDTKMCRFSENVYDAARFEYWSDAQQLASKARGDVIKFNPITGSVSNA